jgi:hypothetical protein
MFLTGRWSAYMRVASWGIFWHDPLSCHVALQGYIKMADFGFAKKIGNDTTFTICGTPDYQVRVITLTLLL